MFHARTVLAFTVVAMTSLLPYNLFMNAHEYFYYKLRNVSDTGVRGEEDLFTTLAGEYRNQSRLGTEPSTDLQRTYEGWFTVTSGIACILGSLLNTVATNKLSNGFRVLSGHAIVLLSLMPTLFYTFVDTDQDQSHFFWLSMFFSSISSFGSMGLIGAGITGLAATFPESYMQMVMIGQALAGICTSLLSILCQAATANSILNGRIYFGIAFIWTFFSVLCYFCLVRSNYAKAVIERAEDGDRLLGGEDEDESEEVDFVEIDDHDAVLSLTPMESSSLFEGWGEILEQSRSSMGCAMFVLIVTLAAFPAVASQVRTETLNPTWRAYFSSICCFLLFNCCDAMGRVFASRVDISRSQLHQLSFARLLLLPLIVVCDVQPRFHLPTLIRNDAIFILLNMTLALSHGFCFTHAYVKGVQSVEPALKETAGSMMSLACVVAALIGSMVGVGIVAIM